MNNNNNQWNWTKHPLPLLDMSDVSVTNKMDVTNNVDSGYQYDSFREPGNRGPAVSKEEDHYLQVYGTPSIHECMLKDRVRTKGYYNAICHNKHVFKDKVVLDVGCGTGILSLFAAKAGAKKVFGVESSKMADCAKQIMIDNKVDHIVTIIKGKLEDVELPVKTVDIIVSEFMGICLFWESMIETVIFARDKWLKEGGFIFPDLCSFYIVGVWDPYRKKRMIDYWSNFTVNASYDRIQEYENIINPFSAEARVLDRRAMNFDFHSMRRGLLSRPLIYTLGPKQVATEPCLLTKVDMNSVTAADLRSMTLPFSMKTTWIGEMHAFATYFDVEFTKCYKKEGFSTSPNSPKTHWSQTVFFLDEEIKIAKHEVMTGKFIMNKNKEHERNIDMEIIFDYNGGWGIHRKQWHEENYYYSR